MQRFRIPEALFFVFLEVVFGAKRIAFSGKKLPEFMV